LKAQTYPIALDFKLSLVDPHPGQVIEAAIHVRDESLHIDLRIVQNLPVGNLLCLRRYEIEYVFNAPS
jgi:hypothetical protein